MPSDEGETGPPPWAAAAADRLRFLASRGDRGRGAALRRELDATLPALRRPTALGGFLRACLDLIEGEAATRPDLAEVTGEVVALCGLARAALDGDLDDRPLLARRQGRTDPPGVAGWAIRVPGRAVWLAVMAAAVPGEEAAAAAMLASDLAAVDLDLPLRALRAAAR